MYKVIQVISQSRVARFLGVGGVCGMIQLLLLHIFVTQLDLQERSLQSVANVVAFVLSATVKFWMSYNHVWSDRKQSTFSWLQFVTWWKWALLLAGANFIAFQGASVVTRAQVASALSIVATTTFNFLASDRKVFRRKETDSNAKAHANSSCLSGLQRGGKHPASH